MRELLPDGVVAEACERTGLDDFGPGDFREGLAVLCASIDDEARLNELGELAVRDALVNSLANRLRVFDWIRRHPEVARERVEAPVVVIGMFAIVLLARFIDVRRPPVDAAVQDENLYLNAKTAQRLSLAFNGLAADWYWMRSLQYTGGKIVAYEDANPEAFTLADLDLHLLPSLLKTSN